MVDYSTTPRYRIEAVDYELEIIGVRLVNWYYAFASVPMLTLVFGPFVSFPIAITIVIFSRRFYAAERRGEPVTFNPKVQRFLRKMAFFDLIFPELGRLEYARPAYRP